MNRTLLTFMLILLADQIYARDLVTIDNTFATRERSDGAIAFIPLDEIKAHHSLRGIVEEIKRTLPSTKSYQRVSKQRKSISLRIAPVINARAGDHIANLAIVGMYVWLINDQVWQLGFDQKQQLTCSRDPQRMCGVLASLGVLPARIVSRPEFRLSFAPGFQQEVGFASDALSVEQVPLITKNLVALMNSL